LPNQSLPIIYEDLIIEPGEVELRISASFFKFVMPRDRMDDLYKLLEGELVELLSFLEDGVLTDKALEKIRGLNPDLRVWRRFVGLQKTLPIVDIIKSELKAGKYKKLVVYTTNKDTLEILRIYLEDYKPKCIYLKTKEARILQRVAHFQKLKEVYIFIAQINAVEDICLSAANDIIFIEPDLSPKNNARAVAICHTFSKIKPITVRFVGLANSLDQQLSATLKRKTEEVDEIIHGEKHVAYTTNLIDDLI